MKRKVAIITGEFAEGKDFVLEPVCSECEVDGNECEVCKNYIYIEEVKE